VIVWQSRSSKKYSDGVQRSKASNQQKHNQHAKASVLKRAIKVMSFPLTAAVGKFGMRRNEEKSY
jgi:hypothetical protein